MWIIIIIIYYMYWMNIITNNNNSILHITYNSSILFLIRKDINVMLVT